MDRPRQNFLHDSWSPKEARSTGRVSHFTGQIEERVEHFKNRIIREANLEEIIKLPVEERKRTIERMVYQMIQEEKEIYPRDVLETIVKLIVNESVGYGPLEVLLQDPEITEIMVNGPNDVFIEKNGRLEKTSIGFKDEAHIRHIIDRIIAPLGRRIDDSSPMVDARLPDGSRVNAVIPPISLNGPVLSIRKFNRVPITLERLVELGSVAPEMAEFMKALVRAKVNILFSGGTGSGKTTLLNALSQFLPEGERIITIEDMAELKIMHPNLVRLEARPANVEGRGEITIRQLVRNALRMRPDRIIVGEVRGPEAIDMLQAMNTGHEGSLTTLHANSAQDAIGRLEAMVLMSDLPLNVEVVDRHFISAIEIIIQAERMIDGSRRVVSISEVVLQDGQIDVRDIFAFRYRVSAHNQVEGRHVATGYVPRVYEKILRLGIDLPRTIFAGEGEGTPDARPHPRLSRA
ncbi:MAG: Type II/IV secretion system ATP hydrolase TadA/VirB11/CpaF, TadA subfamily [Hydrogenibacillus schlegelii]|uniref:Type II/IV secretion system ATP hydrolase TadA/VirB11/CpaF, TadA subfamily n=1 Tax=Hydrogenibacillus schlegelii TaxID=1484 RepID=A0A2T5GBK4_HYDSH|nr:CpaF family protein [Hydrogenibacillus schlegelii]PTQ53567.1 MAG: Type II/IV secretion system ATP hydrolase TadA/VirB11/CpaF, TadA subfamily [Hydrogenibacillus schlegelii]